MVDLAHGIRGVRAGSVILRQSVVEAPDGSVHLAVVDPGVGTDRRGVVIAARRGDVLVGPDNGLLTPAADALGGVAAAFELTNIRYQRESVSATFHGRDIFAPAAAYLSLGVRADDFGAGIDASSLVRVPEPSTSISSGELTSDVARVDWYGNLQLAATASELEQAGFGERVVVGELDATIGKTFSDAAPGGLVVYVDSGRHVAIARNGGSARDLLQDPERVTLKSKS